MLNLIRKTMWAGIGTLFLTKEKIEELAREISKEASLTEAEGRKWFDELLKKSDEAKKSMLEFVNKAVDSTLSKTPLASQADIEKLEQRIKDLETKMNLGAEPRLD